MADLTASFPTTDDVLANTLRLPAHAVSRKTSAGLTMLFDRAKGVMYELNETASAVIEQFGPEPRRVGDIVDALTAEFDADPGEIAEDVFAFVEDFTAAGLLIKE
jgi:Coenzyme PQQ synthesis protein D (PqqD)